MIPSQLSYPLFYLTSVPVATFICQPTGLVSRCIQPLIALSGVQDYRLVIGLGLFYSAVVYVALPLLSLMERDHVRSSKLTGHRVSSADYRFASAQQSLLDVFPFFALAMIFALAREGVAWSPCSVYYSLVLHVFMEVFVYFPASILEYDTLRSGVHFLAIGALLNGLLELTTC
ncbi:hypothetical protein FRC03_007065 [Tulasnella sp. 419]|nr:hypothetical protein FRC03_007065 [Tulasnella sp. 419]